MKKSVYPVLAFLSLMTSQAFAWDGFFDGQILADYCQQDERTLLSQYVIAIADEMLIGSEMMIDHKATRQYSRFCAPIDRPPVEKIVGLVCSYIKAHPGSDLAPPVIVRAALSEAYPCQE